MSEAKPYVYSQEMERKIGSASATALGKLAQGQEVDRQKARAMRDRMYSWLVRVGDLVQKPGLAVGVEMAALLDEELQNALNDEHSATALAVLDAWTSLPDEVALQIVSRMISRLYTSSRQGLLVSRQAPQRAWAATGFHYDRSMHTIFAKVGDEAFEPIGFDDDVHYLPTAGSKTLWKREWAMAVLLPFGPAFEVSQEQAPQQEVSDAVALSERERAKIAEVITWLDEDIVVWKKLALVAAHILTLPADQQQVAAQKNKNDRNEHQFKIRESVKLACIQLPRLDQKLQSFAAEHPEVGENMEKVAPEELIRIVREFLQLKLDDDHMRRMIEGTELVVPTDGVPSVVQQLHTRLSALMAKPEAEQDGDEMNSVLSGARAAVPELNMLLGTFGDEHPEALASDGARVTLEWLTQRLKPAVT